MSDPSPHLVELAAAYGVAADYLDWRDEAVHVPTTTLVAVLAALGVEAGSDESCRAALDERRATAWRRVLPPYLVTVQGSAAVLDVHVPDGDSVDVWLTLEDGSFHTDLRQVPNDVAAAEIDGRWTGEASFEIPATVPTGYHRVHAHTAGETTSAELIVGPSWVGMPARTGDRPRWGVATQLYSVRSHRSWGTGDLADLADLSAWATTQHGADFVLVNPMHAAQPKPPLEASPYLPTTRRFANPLYLRVERIPEYAQLDPSARARVDELRAGLDDDPEALIDRDSAWQAKRRALKIVYRHGRDPGREFAYRAYLDREGTALDDYATWCVLSEKHGGDWHSWPADLQHPSSPAVTVFAGRRRKRVDFHRWLQWLLDEQLAETQGGARRAGMALGIVHDLAVGVSPNGADSWTHQDELARGISVGAPPDAYAQTGQDWQQPPWRPDRLAELAYAPFRALVATALRHSGGLRVDHVIGLFRLWWIPGGRSPIEGTYVRYDHEAFLAVLALEATRADAVVIGEDLGVVEPWVRDVLRERGLLGTSVLWFERDYEGDGTPRPPEDWREYCLATVTTHDLPPTAGYLDGDHVRLRDQLGLLTRSLDEELAADAAEQAAWLHVLRSRGLLSDDADIDATVVALHRALAQAPARLRCLSLTDAVGDRRTQNQPGANVGYPNWRVPLSGPDGRAMHLEDVFTSERAARLAEIMRG